MAQLTQRETPAPARAAAAGFLAAVAASVLLGLLSALIWHEVAPRPVLQQIGAGTAEVVNPETRAFIGADGWFCVISAVAGLLTGITGYRIGIARRGSATRAAVALGLILGAVAGGYTMLWLGQEIGSAAYQHQLADAATGATYTASQWSSSWPSLAGASRPPPLAAPGRPVAGPHPATPSHPAPPAPVTLGLLAIPGLPACPAAPSLLTRSVPLRPEDPRAVSSIRAARADRDGSS
jgi:hypothetical protein